ncbi:MAG: DUF4129 domain-containing protein, partial [Anaerolineae bacterium]
MDVSVPLQFRTSVRRELVFLALGVMDVCVFTPLFVAFLTPHIDFGPWSILGVLLAAILTIHYIGRLAFSLSLDFRLRSSLIALGMVLTGLLSMWGVLYSEISVWELRWLGSIYRSLRESIFAPDVLVFLLVVFLWWRGFVLAQRRLDSRSVAFRFRLGVVILAISTGIAGSMLDWPYHLFVFLFFFSSLLGIALSRAQEVGQQYGGRLAAFSLGWMTTMVTVSATVLALAAGLTSVLTGNALGRVLSPALAAFQILVFALVYALAWAAQFVIEPLLMLLRRYEIGRALSEVFDQITFPPGPTDEDPPAKPAFTPEQLETLRVVVASLGAIMVLLLVAISLYRLRARAGGSTDEVRESVWEGVQLRRSLEGLLTGARRRLRDVSDTLAASRVGHLFAKLTIRTIYAHMAALAASHGYPRSVDETPYDYLPTLRQAFPRSEDEVTRITESYVAVHYGELPERQEDLATVRSA